MIQELSIQEAQSVLQNQYIGHLAYVVGQQPYCLPITYYYSQELNALISYAVEGHKIKAMRENPNVSIMVSSIDSPTSWRSVQVHGTFEELHSIDAKFNLHEFTDGVKEVIRRTEKKHPEFIGEFSAELEAVGSPIVYRIRIGDLTAKARRENEHKDF